MVKEVIVVIRQSERTFVNKVHFRSSVPASGDMTVITDLGVLRRIGDELTLTRIHPGVSVDQAREAAGWDLRVADDLEESESPSEEELRVLRELRSALEEAKA